MSRRCDIRQQTQKRRGKQQKIDCKLSYQDECYSAMAQCFIFSPSFQSFRVFRDECYLQMMNTLAGENDFKTLSISHLKVRVNTEYNAFANAAKTEVTEHYEECHKNRFSQFAHDGATLKKQINLLT